ncbi:zip zinc transporter protein [Lichtheimia corymbifera JMRC:FSU:9682]|uniref:Zip zinc transporter protein n=1 Tax=Lichtheimia corymbifera JMRC:FSU:9682 TaxID=1263082 RepID=A0A068RN57_9FUNG|nr:zip zinc transporter protein [Lichtheimia corymbifera JMRC:FSU:9682]
MTISSQHLQGSLLVLISSIACVIGASIVFIDTLWPQKSILENQSFLAASMALASGVLLYSSLAVLLPEAVERLDDSYLVYVGFFGGALFTLILTRIIHWCTPGAVHACGGSPSMDQRRDEESGHCSSSSSTSTTSNHDEEDGHTSAGSRTIAYTERHSIKHHPVSAQGSTQYGTTTTKAVVAPFSEAHFRIHSMATRGQQHDHHHHDHHHHHHQDNDNHHHDDHDDSSEDSHSFLRIGIQTAVAIGVHKFPEGLIMFVSNQASSSLGWSVAAAMSIHNLTEGFMIALPLYFALRSRTAAFGWASLLGGLSQPLGAMIGYFLLQSIDKSQENLMFGMVFSLVSGMMTLITVQSMLPQAIKADTKHKQVLPFFFLGIFCVAASSFLESI